MIIFKLEFFVSTLKSVSFVILNVNLEKYYVNAKRSKLDLHQITSNWLNIWYMYVCGKNRKCISSTVIKNGKSVIRVQYKLFRNFDNQLKHPFTRLKTDTHPYCSLFIVPISYIIISLFVFGPSIVLSNPFSFQQRSLPYSVAREVDKSRS